MWGWLSFLCLIKVPIMPSLKSFYSPCVCSLCLQSNSQQISQGASWLNNRTLNRSTLGVSFHNTCLFLTNPFHLHSVDVALPMDHNSWDRWFDGASSKWCLLRQPVSFSIQIWCIKSPNLLCYRHEGYFNLWCLMRCMRLDRTIKWWKNPIGLHWRIWAISRDQDITET